MSSEQRDFDASLYAFRLVTCYFCRAGFITFKLPVLRVLHWPVQITLQSLGDVAIIQSTLSKAALVSTGQKFSFYIRQCIVFNL